MSINASMSLYHSLPSHLRIIAVTLRGCYLRLSRYGGDTEDLVNEALQRDAWTQAQWRSWHEERLAYILHRAATQVPYYRSQWERRRRAGDRASWEILENWPLLSKEMVRAHGRAFIASDCSPRRMIRDVTSGTTGTPITVYAKPRTVRRWYALYEARVRRWHGVSIHERWAIFGGQLIVPFHQTRPPFWVRNVALNQMYFSTHHLSTATAPYYWDALKRYRPTHIVGYPSALHVLAATTGNSPATYPELRAIFSNAELLTDEHRRIISRAFGVPVRNTYGMAETCVAASECAEDSMHLWPEVGMLEAIPNGSSDDTASTTASLVAVTGLLNEDMPLIRYVVGDRAVLDNSGMGCRCGRELPLLGSVEGRSNDVILRADGRRIFWLNPVFYQLPLVEAQIIQESLDELRVVIVPAEGFAKTDEATIVARLQSRVGDMKIHVERIDRIQRTPGGKLQTIVSRPAIRDFAAELRRQ